MAKTTPHQYPVHLSPEQRARLTELTRVGHGSAAQRRRAQVLLLSDRDRLGGRVMREQIADLLDMHVNSVARICKRFVLEGESPAIERKRRATPPTPVKLDGRKQAALVAICCSPAPRGRVCWTLQLLADELVRRRIVTSVCIETVRKTLEKTGCSLGGNNAGVSPSATPPASSRKWKKSSTSTKRRTARTSR